MNTSADVGAEVPARALTRTSTALAVWAGLVAVMTVPDGSIANEEAAVPPKVTPVASANPWPEMTTRVPPLTLPATGEMPDTTPI